MRTETTERVCDAQADEVWAYLRAHHRGRQQAIRQADLARTLGLNPRVLQHLLAYLLEERDCIVCSACSPPYGVYVPQNRQEREDYARQLEHRIIGCAKRLRKLTRTPLVRVSWQKELF